jgi:hypothetical protein
MAVSASLRALLDRVIDYAGMFPPCALALEPTLRNQASYVRSVGAWMLNGFVLPIGQFDPAKQFVSEFDPQHLLRVAALGPKTASVDAFLEALANAATAIASFSGYKANVVSVSHLEMLLPDDVDSASLKRASKIVDQLPAFWEAPPERAEETIALIAGHNSDENTATFGYKLRTGGVTAEAFPTSAADQVYRRTASSYPPIPRRSENQDARISECARSRSSGGRTSVGCQPNCGDARGRRSALLFVH